jgi:hypothetical protein
MIMNVASYDPGTKDSLTVPSPGLEPFKSLIFREVASQICT